jgi:hypothetical protein
LDALRHLAESRLADAQVLFSPSLRRNVQVHDYGAACMVFGQRRYGQ